MQIKEILMEYTFDSNRPIYLQIAEILEERIITGIYASGDKLPSVREIAVSTKTNPNTVMKALSQLESKGLIETRRTSGKYVRSQDDDLKTIRNEKAKSLCLNLIADLEKLGYSQNEISELWKENFAHASESKQSSEII